MTAPPDKAQFADAKLLPEAQEEIVWVPIGDLRIGMFVHPLCRQSFKLKHPRDLAALIDSDVKGVFVDLTKSTTPRPKRSVPAPAKRGRSADKAAAAAFAASAPPAAPAILPDAAARRAAQFERAAKVLDDVRAPVASLLDDARLGKVIGGGAVAGIVDQITQSVADNATAIISLARIRDKDRFTYAHSVAVCALMANLARRMDLDAAAQQELGVAGLLHDVGKMLIPPAILNKPGRLSDDEMDVMRSHVTRGHDLLKRSGSLPAAALEVCLSHHEKIDGSGYPDNLAGDRIGLAARMGAVCDVYDAITSNRPYKEAWSPAECLASMYSWQGHFDEEILSLFIRSVGIYPVGNLVRMHSNHLAVIVGQDEADLTRPVVRLFYSLSAGVRITPRDVRLTEDAGDAILSREEPGQWGFDDWNGTWPTLIAG